MPDLVTHLSSGYLLGPAAARQRAWRFTFYLGALLPDLLTRPFYIIQPDWFWIVAPLHTPVGYVVAAWLLVQLLDQRDDRRQAFRALLLGGMLHFALDALQRHLGLGYTWLFPISWKSYHWGLFWPEDSLKIVPISAVVILAGEALSRRRGW